MQAHVNRVKGILALHDRPKAIVAFAAADYISIPTNINVWKNGRSLLLVRSKRNKKLS